VAGDPLEDDLPAGASGRRRGQLAVRACLVLDEIHAALDLLILVEHVDGSAVAQLAWNCGTKSGATGEAGEGSAATVKDDGQTMKDGRVPLVQPSRFYPALGIEPEDTAQAVRDDAGVDVAPLALRDDSVKVAGTEAGAAAPQVSVIRDNRPASREGGRDEPLGKEDVDRPKVERPRPDGLRVPEHAALPPRSAMATANAPAHVRSTPGDRLPLKNECLAEGRHRHARRQDILNAAESFGDEKLLAGNPIAPQSLEGRPGPEAMGRSGAVQERARRGGLDTYCGVKVRSLESSAARSWTCPTPSPGFSGQVTLPNLRRDKGGSVRPVSNKLALAPQGDSPCFDASRRLAVIGPRRVRRPGARTSLLEVERVPELGLVDVLAGRSVLRRERDQDRVAAEVARPADVFVLLAHILDGAQPVMTGVWLGLEMTDAAPRLVAALDDVERRRLTRLSIRQKQGGRVGGQRAAI
jgi:hypothetical protein